MSGSSTKMHLERLRFACFATAIFTVLTLPRLLAHELWRDEAWLWLVVTESANLSDLAASLARSGQGYLFPLLCYLAKGISKSPFTLQCVNLVLAAAGVFVFARWAPFRRSHRALFVLGYLPFYEYAVLSRHYAAGLLLLWLACAAVRSRSSALALGAVLGLLCQTTVYGYILALAVAGGWLVDRWLRRRRTGRPPGSTELPGPSISRRSRSAVAAGLALAVAGGVAGLLQLIPDAGTSFAQAWRFGWYPEIAVRVLQMPWRAFVPLPQPGLHFWNTNLLDPWPALQAAAGLGMLLLAIALVWPRKAALATLLIGAAGFAGFGYVKFVGAMRHDGHWWLLGVAALWLAGGLPTAAGVRDDGDDGAGSAGGEHPARRRSWRDPVFGALLLVHCAAGAYASWIDLGHPFSNGARTATAIRDRGLDRLPLLGYREPPAASVALALGKPLFSPSRGKFVTHPDWGPEQRDLTLDELRCTARHLAAHADSDIVLVLNRELPAWAEVEEAGAAVLGAIQASEDYHLYRLLHGRLQATAAAARCTSG